MFTIAITAIIAFICGLAFILIQDLFFGSKRMVEWNWRSVLAVLPLPTLALAASYGVWSFNSLYLPMWAAVVSAASFELVYLGLAVAHLSEPQRVRAKKISYGAVGVSVVYNTLAGLAHRQPQYFTDLQWYSEALLAIVHGAPLAIVAYLVSDLLIHREHGTSDTMRLHVPVLALARVPEQPSYPEPVQIQDAPKVVAETSDTVAHRPETYDLTQLDRVLVSGETVSPAELVQRIGASRSTINRLVKQAISAGTMVQEGRGIYRVV